MSKPDPRTLAISPAAPFTQASVDDTDAWAEDGDDGHALWRLFGAATLAVVALAVASVVLV